MYSIVHAYPNGKAPGALYVDIRNHYPRYRSLSVGQYRIFAACVIVLTISGSVSSAGMLAVEDIRAATRKSIGKKRPTTMHWKSRRNMYGIMLSMRGCTDSCRRKAMGNW